MGIKGYRVQLMNSLKTSESKDSRMSAETERNPLSQREGRFESGGLPRRNPMLV